MAYVIQDDEQQDQQAPLQGGSQLIGGGVPTEQKKTAAGKPGGWVNIQDYLRANPTAGQEMAGRVRERADQRAEDIRGEFAGEMDGFNPQDYTNMYDEGAAKSYVEAGGDLGQFESVYDREGWERPDFFQAGESALESEQQKAEKMKPGQFKTIMDYFGQTKPEESRYTPGMQQLDQMFLMNEPGFAQNFPGEYQQQLADIGTEYGDIEKQRTNQIINLQETERMEMLDAIDAYEAEIRSQIDEALAAQQAQIEPGAIPQSVQDIVDQYAAQGITIDPSQYMTISGRVDPTAETAMAEVLSPEEMMRYNQIANLIGSDILEYPERRFSAGEEIYDEQAMIDYAEGLLSEQRNTAQADFYESEASNVVANQLWNDLAGHGGKFGGGKVDVAGYETKQELADALKDPHKAADIFNTIEKSYRGYEYLDDPMVAYLTGAGGVPEFDLSQVSYNPYIPGP